MVRDPPILDANDYTIDQKCIAQGAWGSVHRAVKKLTQEVVAMKFFGYTVNRPDRHKISEEVSCMLQLEGVSGVAQLIGVFVDTKTGLVPNKNKKFNNEYTVIVMDFLEGGDLFSMVNKRIANKQVVNERFLAPAFRSAMESLLSIHNRNYIHRDLKLDNMVLTSTGENPVVKIIDCGHFAYTTTGVQREPNLVGSLGYFAPESANRRSGLREYSTKTDVWQAGCALYMMLSATLPFRQDIELINVIISGRYFSLETSVWQDISPLAKDLVAGMLKLHPAERLSVTQVLQHPWLTNLEELPTVPLGSDYVLRIQGLELRKKLKIGFQAGNIEQNHKELKENFQEELPFLAATPSDDKDKNELDLEATAILTSEEFQHNLKRLKGAVMERISRSTSQESVNNDDDNRVYLTAPVLEKQRSSIYGEDINLSEFIQLVTKCDLHCLATDRIFSIFDYNCNGLVNMKQFLFALIALRPFESTESECSDLTTDAAELYFHFFDLDGDGYIELPELKIAFNCLFQDCHFDDSILSPMEKKGTNDSTVRIFDAESVFKQMDTNNDNKIDIKEFKKFYNDILAVTISQQIMSVNGSLLPSLCSQERVASLRRNSVNGMLDAEVQDHTNSVCGDGEHGVGMKRPRESESEGRHVDVLS